MAWRAGVVGLGLLVAWQLLVWATGAPPYILPGPLLVLGAVLDDGDLLFEHALTTFAEIGLGLVLGCALGMLTALLMIRFAAMRRWLLPVLVMSQAVPVFALAPVLVLWIGYGMGSKVAMAVIIIFFPVTAAFDDGLRRADSGWLDLARTMGASATAELIHVRLPAALPALASGIRVATAVAPIGAVVGEWVGSGAGLGHLMLHANGRMQIDLMFAALLVLAVFAVGLYLVVDAGLKRLTRWCPETSPGAVRPPAAA